MGDIDFEELDRAVSSLMNKTSSQQSSAPAQDAPSLPAEEESTPLVQATEPVKSETPASSPSPVIARRSTGRFMDVKPSSATGRPSAPVRPAPSPAPSREGVMIGSVDSSFVAEETTESETQVDPSMQEYFDPQTVDMADTGTDSTVEQNVFMDESGVGPLSSPFLEGISIDKRPLGAPTTPAAIASEETPPQVDDQETGVDSMPDPIDFANQTQFEQAQGESSPWEAESEADIPVADEPLQPELSPEVLAVESMSLEQGIISSDQVTDEGSGLESGQRDAPPVQPVVSSNLAGATSVPSTPSAPAVGDIRPQYTSSNADMPAPSAVFEAASEMPGELAHPEKKRSGWSIVLWILLMVAVGVAGGVGVWYFLVR